jgi:hypothetical protein
VVPSGLLLIRIVVDGLLATLIPIGAAAHADNVYIRHTHDVSMEVSQRSGRTGLTTRASADDT